MNGTIFNAFLLLLLMMYSFEATRTRGNIVTCFICFNHLQFHLPYHEAMQYSLQTTRVRCIIVYHWVLGGSLLNHDSFFSPTSQLILVSWSPGICLLGHKIPSLKFHWSSDNYNPQTSTMPLCPTKMTPMTRYCSTCMHLSNTFCHHRSIQHVSGSASHTSLVSFMSHRCRLRVSHGSHVTAAEATLFYLSGSVDYATLCLMNLMIEWGERLEVKRIQKGNSLSRPHSTPMTTASSTSTTMAVAFWRKPRGRMTSLYTS